MLVLTSGRPGIGLWLAHDGSGSSWSGYDVEAVHNKAVPADPFTKDSGTTSYTGLAEVEPGVVLLSYDKIGADRKGDLQGVYSVRVAVAPTRRGLDRSAAATGAGATPCCNATCTAPTIKYYSVDHGVGHTPFCGETCLDPKRFGLFHLFEKNLTEAHGEHPCSHQLTPDGGLYSVYNSTVTHGVPGLSITLDLYQEGGP